VFMKAPCDPSGTMGPVTFFHDGRSKKRAERLCFSWKSGE